MSRVMAAMFLIVILSPFLLALQEQGPTLARAQALRAEHKGAEAEVLLQRYLSKYYNDPDALTLLAQIKLDGGSREEAQTLLVQALEAHPDSLAANRLAGSMLLQAQQYPQAMDRFETVLAVQPKDKEARQGEREAATRLATTVRSAGAEEVTLQVLEHARSKLPDDPELLLALGMEAVDVHKLPEAAEALQVARKLSPTSPDILYGLVRVEIDQQHLEAAERDMRSYLALRPSDASAYFGLGHIYAMEQRSEDARKEFERSLHLQPIQTESYYEIGQLDLNAQNDAQAKPLFQKVIARDPNHGGALVGLGQIAFRDKDYAAAESYLVRAVKAAPKYPPAHYYYGLTLSRLGRKAEADQELQLSTQLGHDAGPSSARQ